jgi:hypothetical protein
MYIVSMEAPMKKQTFWIGSMEFQGYPWHVVSATKTGAEQALLKEYKKQKERDLKNPTFPELQEYLGAWIQEAKLDEVVWP